MQAAKQPEMLSDYLDELGAPQAFIKTGRVPPMVRPTDQELQKHATSPHVSSAKSSAMIFQLRALEEHWAALISDKQILIQIAIGINKCLNRSSCDGG